MFGLDLKHVASFLSQEDTKEKYKVFKRFGWKCTMKKLTYTKKFLNFLFLLSFPCKFCVEMYCSSWIRLVYFSLISISDCFKLKIPFISSREELFYLQFRLKL
jgi:hypothetical protein